MHTFQAIEPLDNLIIRTWKSKRGCWAGNVHIVSVANAYLRLFREVLVTVIFIDIKSISSVGASTIACG